ncbi:MAG: WD40 repeat domain-containing protein [Okeania sp. SIO3H1]|uniref:WD40 domain-containing protein n=1 Tax=Okeania sp. SIO1I7 TaxID=2607772 RepID=UPI0013C717FD|nr:hypothetical protein [Okeania sp. SIO1I7]NEN87793.1 WD40 repeat domain-containing protein [Okeania sp. SIO3H1]NET26949.1 WD40 repeat domain-containing protein [Okeania sp. SIO1I7]
MDIKNYNIITLGPSGAGKTVFLASLFKKLSTPTKEGFFLEISDNKQRKKLKEIYSKIANTNEEWPIGTRILTRTTFTCYVKDHNLENVEVCKFTYIDYGGGAIISDEDDSVNLKKEEVDNADALLVMIDGLKLLKLMEGKDQDNEVVTQLSMTDLPNMMELLNKANKDIPVYFVISKWDLLKGHYNLSDIIKRLRDKVRELDDIVNLRVNAGCPVRFIPVSSIGLDFATLQSDDSMKKNPGATPELFQLEIPVAYVLIDKVTGGNKAIKSSSEKITRWGVKNPFSNGRADEVEDWETANNHLVISFLKRLKNFEEQFPEANLGTQSHPTLPSIHTFRRHKKVVCSVGFTSDGKTLFSSNDDGTVLFWEVARRNLQKEIVREKPGWVVAHLSQDDQKLFTASAYQSIKVWDAHTGKLFYELSKEHSEQISGFVVSPDGSKLISSSRDQTVKIWQLETNGARVMRTLSEHQGLVYTLAVTPNWDTLATGGTDKKILIWELPINNDKFLTLKHPNPSFIKALAFSSDGKMLVSGGDDQTICVWDKETWNLKFSLRGHTGAIWSLAISPDNRFLASGSDDGEIKVWNLSTGTLITTLTEHTDMITTLAFSPDNQILASGSDDKTIKIWPII